MHGLVLHGLDITADLCRLVFVLKTKGLVLYNLLLLAGELLLWWHGGRGSVGMEWESVVRSL